MTDDLIIDITIKHKGIQFPATVVLKKEEQTWEKFTSIVDGLGTSIKRAVGKNKIILNPLCKGENQY